MGVFLSGRLFGPTYELGQACLLFSLLRGRYSLVPSAEVEMRKGPWAHGVIQKEHTPRSRGSANEDPDRELIRSNTARSTYSVSDRSDLKFSGNLM